jgi:hypothetical protein
MTEHEFLDAIGKTKEHIQVGAGRSWAGWLRASTWLGWRA